MTSDIRTRGLSRSKRFCSVPQCSTYGSESIPLHLFPISNKELCEKWRIAVKIEKPITKYMNVCGKHFLEEDYLPTTALRRVKRLKKGAIPSQNIPMRFHDMYSEIVYCNSISENNTEEHIFVGDIKKEDETESNHQRDCDFSKFRLTENDPLAVSDDDDDALNSNHLQYVKNIKKIARISLKKLKRLD